jgi:hypothetical protein
MLAPAVGMRQTRIHSVMMVVVRMDVILVVAMSVLSMRVIGTPAQNFPQSPDKQTQADRHYQPPGDQTK